MPASRALQTPKTPVSTWERPFVVDRNIRHFVWYGGVAGEGLRSDGVDDLPLSKSVCSILPIARHLRAGESSAGHANPGPRLAAKASGGPIGTAPNQSPGLQPPPALRVPRRA